MAILKTYSMKTMKPSKGIKYKPSLKSVGSGIKKSQPVVQPFKKFDPKSVVRKSEMPYKKMMMPKMMKKLMVLKKRMLAK